MTKKTLQRYIAIIVFCIVVLLACMVASIYYPYPNGQSIGIKSFVMLWFRELFILGAILIAIILAGGSGLWRHFKESKSREK
jgi:hypothetical protein